MLVRLPAYTLQVANEAAAAIGTTPAAILSDAINVTALHQIEQDRLPQEPMHPRTGKVGRPRLEFPLVQTGIPGIHNATRRAVVETAKRMGVSEARLIRALCDRHLGQFLHV